MRWVFPVYLSFMMATSLGSALGAPAQQLLGKFGDWRVATTQWGSETTCLVTARTPDKGAYILVTRKAKSLDPVVITFGLRADVDLAQPLEVRIGSRHFPLMAKGDRAWVTSDKEETRLLAAMEAGKNLMVRMTRKGKQHQDTYALKGFFEAWAKAYAVCTP